MGTKTSYLRMPQRLLMDRRVKEARFGGKPGDNTTETASEAALEVNRPLGHRQRGLLHRFGQGRMRVAGARDVFGGSAELHCHCGLSDHVPASDPTMCTPSTRSVLVSARIFTKPSICGLALARPLVVNGNFPAS